MLADVVFFVDYLTLNRLISEARQKKLLVMLFVLFDYNDKLSME